MLIHADNGRRTMDGPLSRTMSSSNWSGNTDRFRSCWRHNSSCLKSGAMPRMRALPSGKWLDVGENGYLTNAYLAEVCAAAHARMFVSYATGGAEWYPDHLSFMFSRRNPARTALLTAHWEPPEKLKDLLVSQECRYHRARAFDLYRAMSGGMIEVIEVGEPLAPLTLYRLDHGDPPFMKASKKR